MRLAMGQFFYLKSGSEVGQTPRAEWDRLKREPRGHLRGEGMGAVTTTSPLEISKAGLAFSYCSNFQLLLSLLLQN